MIGRAPQPRSQGVDDLLVGFGESRLGGVGIGVALDVAKQPQQDLDGFEIGLGRAVIQGAD